MVSEILTYLQIGAVCMINPGENERRIIIVGAGDYTGEITKLIANIDESMPIIIIGDTILANCDDDIIENLQEITEKFTKESIPIVAIDDIANRTSNCLS